ncbi:DNA damage-regulated autophagy modulator protein 1 [Thalassophryne amazonica]|uniref:DNA damage-regulated autophagy modulator protein 1 n=1 Tax=Thalassophryne amazonica TaxID=390379 RepID=UPI00147140C8|nr:DNA damage-regulated autophagy modulator protein 1 [Thalassophryne amazonica]
MFWFQQGLCFLPTFLVIWASFTFVVPYFIAIFRRDVDILFPYISSTGTTPPESCIFGLMTFISACAGIATIYARYKFVEKLSHEPGVSDLRLNKAALGLGLLSCLGMCIVATFQETAVTEVHDFGALLFFIPGVLYTILQSIISYRSCPYGSSMTLFYVRLFIAIIAILSCVPTVIITAFYVDQAKLHRNPDEKDYRNSIAGAVFEWIAAYSFVCFFLTYIDDFKLFTLRVKAEYKDNS